MNQSASGQHSETVPAVLIPDLDALRMQAVLRFLAFRAGRSIPTSTFPTKE
jgi:hypothetical protein